MPISKKKYFLEKEISGKRRKRVKHSFLVGKVIFKGETNLQNVFIFENPLYGKIFCLDNIVEFSQIDEFIYHEMIVHPVLFSHPNPKDILIIGGGDGGALKEALKHPVKKVDLVEIDKEIIKISKKYLKFSHQNSFSDQRVNIHSLPGEDFVRTRKNFYDVIIVDPSNPEPDTFSPPLFSVPFYRDVFSALKKDGIMVTLGAPFLDFENIIRKIFKKLKKIFPHAVIYRFCMPSYNCGEYSFLAASKKANLRNIDFKGIKKRFNKLAKKNKFAYYSPEIHKSSMVLPKIWQTK